MRAHPITQREGEAVMLTYLKLLMARSNELSWNGRNSSSATNLYVGTPGADWLVICDGEWYH